MGIQRSAVGVCALLVVLLLGRHYAWPRFPVHWMADVWNIGAAVPLLVLSFGWALWARSRIVWGVWLAWLWHEACVIVCSLAFIVAPWVIPEGVGQCSAWADADLAKLGVFALIVCCVPLAAHMARKS